MAKKTDERALGEPLPGWGTIHHPPETMEVIPPYMLAGDPPHGLSVHLPDIERMSAQGLEVLQIAMRLGLTESVLTDAAMRFRDVALALTGGRARLWDQASAVLYRKAMAGDTQALTFFLKTKGGFNAPVLLQSEPPRDDSGSAPAPITLDHVRGMAARQAALFVERDRDD